MIVENDANGYHLLWGSTDVNIIVKVVDCLLTTDLDIPDEGSVPTFRDANCSMYNL